MLLQSLIGFGIFSLVIALIFYIPEFGIFGHIWGSEEDSKRAKSVLKPVAKIFLIVGLVSIFSGLGFMVLQ